MSVLDALTILSAGVGRGYRASQEIQRQLAEAKRKYLLDQSEQATREREQALRERLGTSTIASEQQARLESQFKLGEAKTAALEASQPFAPPGGFHPSILGTPINIPNRMSALENPAVSNLLQQEIQGRYSTETANIRGRNAVNIANIRSGFTKAAGTPEQRKAKYIQKAMNPPNPWMPIEDQINFMHASLAVAQQLDAEAFGEPAIPATGKGKKKDTLGVR